MPVMLKVEIPAGTGLKKYNKLVVGNKAQLDSLLTTKTPLKEETLTKDD